MARATRPRSRAHSSRSAANRASPASVAWPNDRHSPKSSNATLPPATASRATHMADVKGRDPLSPTRPAGTDIKARAVFTSWRTTWPRTRLPSSHFCVTFLRSLDMCAARAFVCSFVSTQTGATSEPPSSPPASRRCAYLWL